MSVPWEYLPVRIVARLGQHSGSTTKPFVNETPLSMRAECTPGIESSSHRWSSVRISTMFGCTVKLVALAAVPSGVVTVTGPVRAPRGTVAVICVSESTWNVAWTSLKATADASVKFARECVYITAFTWGHDLITSPAVRIQFALVSDTPLTPQSFGSFSTQPHSSSTMFLARLAAKSWAVVKSDSKVFHVLSPEQEP